MTSSPTDSPGGAAQSSPPPAVVVALPPLPPRSRFVRALRFFFPALLITTLLSAALLLLLPRGEETAVFSSIVIHPARNLVDIEIAGEDSRGRPYRMKAEQAGISRGRGRIILHRIAGEIQLGAQEGAPSGHLFARAQEGLYRPAARQLRLGPGVALFSALGHEIHTQHAEIDFLAETMVLPQGLTAWGPQFILRAGALHAERFSETLHFSGGVRLTLFLPPPAGEVQAPAPLQEDL